MYDLQRWILSGGIVSGCLLFSYNAFAEEQEEQGSDWEIAAGAGIFYGAQHRGIDKTRVTPLPFFEARWKDRVFFNPFDGIGVSAYQGNQLNFSMSLGYGFGRKESFDSSLDGLGDIKDSTVINSKLEYSLGPVNLFAESSKYLDSHQGLEASIGAEAFVPLGLVTGDLTMADMENLKDGEFGDFSALLFSAELLLGDEKYNQAYWGVNQQQSFDSGYERHDVGGGINGWAVSMGLLTPLSDRWQMMLRLEYEKMAGEAADSPFISAPDNTKLGMQFRYEF